jgi:chromate transport protein ChrA
MQTIKKKGFSPSKKSEPQLMTMANKALDLVSLHQKNLTRGAAIVAAVVIIAAGYTLFQSANDKKASAMLAAAQGFYQEQAAGAAPDYAKALELYAQL